MLQKIINFLLSLFGVKQKPKEDPNKGAKTAQESSDDIYPMW